MGTIPSTEKDACWMSCVARIQSCIRRLCSLFFFKTMVAVLGSANNLESAISDNDDRLFSYMSASDDLQSTFTMGCRGSREALSSC